MLKRSCPRFSSLFLFAGAVIVALFAASWPALRLAKLEGTEFMSRLGALLLFALLIERTVEVFLTIWRAEDAYKREAEVQRLIIDVKPPELTFTGRVRRAGIYRNYELIDDPHTEACEEKSQNEAGRRGPTLCFDLVFN